MSVRALIVVLFLGVLAYPASAAEPTDGVAVAKKLFAATVTVRVTAPEAKPGEPAEVTVFSGVSLGKGLVVTFSSAPASWVYRCTLPDGAQADAELRVLDHYSGLRLLEISKHSLPGLEVIEEPPPEGSTLYTAAAAGIDKPVISRGVLGGTDRKFSGRTLPPLLQCDLRTTDTSTGAAVVDSHGRLVGVIAVHSSSGHGDGWTYAVPVKHVLRAQRSFSKGKLINLQSQRPVVGMVTALEGKETVVVEKVTPGGPADKSGIRKGDQIVAVNDKNVRSPYQVAAIVLNDQPGAQMRFSILRDGEPKSVNVTLGGGEVITADQPTSGLRLVGNKGVYQVERSRPNKDGDPAAAIGPEKAAESPRDRVPRDAIGMLDAQVKRIYLALDLLQKENGSLKKELKELIEQNDLLKRELKQIRKQQEAKE
jgi:S1-C subfamily serine protease